MYVPDRQTERETDRQTDRQNFFIKINQSFATTMSLDSDPKDTCAKT